MKNLKLLFLAVASLLVGCTYHTLSNHRKIKLLKLLYQL